MAGQGEDEGRLPASAGPGRRRGVTTGGRVAMVRGLPVPRRPDPPMAGPDSSVEEIGPGRRNLCRFHAVRRRVRSARGHGFAKRKELKRKRRSPAR